MHIEGNSEKYHYDPVIATKYYSFHYANRNM